MFEHLNLTDILAISLITTQVGLTIFYFQISQEGRTRLDSLSAELERLRQQNKALSLKLEETYLLGRLLVRWIEVERDDIETLKSVVDELCIASESETVKNSYGDIAGDCERRDALFLAYKRIALYSEEPSYVLSALRFMSQSAGPGDLLLALRLYARVHEDGSVLFMKRKGWGEEHEVAFLECITEWAARLEISGKNLQFFSIFGEP
jgi:hypothetical protein